VTELLELLMDMSKVDKQSTGEMLVTGCWCNCNNSEARSCIVVGCWARAWSEACKIISV